MYRNKNNGELRLNDVNSSVELVGWVAKKRNFGSLVFIDLRDRYGITQLVINESEMADVNKVKNEYLLHVFGTVVERKDKNFKIETGEIEVVVNKLEIINTSELTPLIIANETDALEDIRLKYRYLDLRRKPIQDKIIARSKITNLIRNFLEDLDFVNVETPMLTKSTPEGARDYLVPSRLQKGKFYALPQSPQMFKQLLMISGLERYYQIARCFRDEDLRADRQPDFTQLDVEMSFLSKDEIFEIIENLMKHIFKNFNNIDIKIPFPRIKYYDALLKYGSDKPDLRFGLEIEDLTELFENTQFSNFRQVLDDGGTIRALKIENGVEKTSRKIEDQLTEIVKKFKGKNIIAIKCNNDSLEGSILKFFTQDEINQLMSRLNIKNSDKIIIVADKIKVVEQSLGAIRLFLGKHLNLIDEKSFHFSWIIDFPLFEYNEQGKLTSCHHPFTLPLENDMELLENQPEKVLSHAYDMVINGYEMLSGSLRIHDQRLQDKIFAILGLSEDEIKDKFGFFIDAFKYGTPPHGGIGMGLDRLIMIMTGAENIREVIAFPKNNSGQCPLTDSPSVVNKLQLDDLDLLIKNNSN